MRGFREAALLAAWLIVAGMAVAQQKPATESNPFPDDTSSIPLTGRVPVYEPPSEATPGTGTTTASIPLPRLDLDPARSPDDPEPSSDDVLESKTFSSSLKGTEDILPPPELDESDRHGKKPPPKTHQEVAADDVTVGLYYLQRKNWRAAMSRFESAMVLDPENPEVYWGLAEAERNLGEFARAKTHYEKLLDYDPEGPHGKAAMKAMKDPQIAGAKAEK